MPNTFDVTHTHIQCCSFSCAKASFFQRIDLLERSPSIPADEWIGFAHH